MQAVSERDRVIEWNEFVQAAQIYQPMSVHMATRFTTGKELHVDSSKGGLKEAADFAPMPPSLSSETLVRIRIAISLSVLGGRANT
jgi:hypothetical protein